MAQQKFKTVDIVIIVLFFVAYMFGYAWLIEPKKGNSRGTEKRTKPELHAVVSDKKPRRTVKSLENEWPTDLGKYFYWINIEPGYEMEEETFEVIGKSGENLLVRRHNDWPDISGHFEWYCNEKLTTTQQMFDYVVAHRRAILRQIQEVRRRGIGQIADEASYFQEHYDEYLDDPEDEIRFPPEIFDANDE